MDEVLSKLRIKLTFKNGKSDPRVARNIDFISLRNESNLLFEITTMDKVIFDSDLGFSDSPLLLEIVRLKKSSMLIKTAK